MVQAVADGWSATDISSLQLLLGLLFARWTVKV